MARRRQADGERFIEADNGFGWTADRSSVAGLTRYRYRTTVFGVEYELEKRGGTQEMFGWYLYSIKGSTHFFGEWCAQNLLPAIDEASKLIVKADLRGEGYERSE
jgi:hypothetical protein